MRIETDRTLRGLRAVMAAGATASSSLARGRGTLAPTDDDSVDPVLAEQVGSLKEDLDRRQVRACGAA